jgi:arylsulfatase A-like enzyme
MTIMQTLKKLIQTYLPLKTGGFGYTIVFLQFFYLYQLTATNDVGGISFSLGSFGLVALSMFSSWWFFQLLATIVSKSRWAVVALSFIGFIFYDLLIAYHFGSQNLVEYSFLISNAGIAFSKESLNVMLSALDQGAINYIAPILLLFLILELRRRTVSRSMQTKPLLKKTIVSTLIYLSLILVPIDSYDPIIGFFRSVCHHYFSPVQFAQTLPPNTYPFESYSDSFITGTISEKTPRPRAVFLIICESLNASVINQYTETGKPITPFLNELSKKSVTVTPFYGNSIQTAKGHFATLFSGIPCLTGKTFVNYPDVKVKSIASVLSQEGYYSVFFNAHNKKNFDNTSHFMLANGYDSFEVVDDYLKSDDQASRLSWGVEDRIYFKRFFDYYDQVLSKKNQPFFATLATIANHFPFTSLSNEQRHLYQDLPTFPRGFKKYYANSVHLTDKGLRVFFEELSKRPELKNSLIIITGDHAFPQGEHGNYNLEAGYHEESFRIPFFMIWDGVLKPKTLNQAASQLDIGPTIIDLLSIKNQITQFQGNSIFNQRDKIIPLIQPYGKHLSIVNYPIKYRYNTRSKKEYASNLITDPQEEKNIIDSLSHQEIAFFREQLRYIYRFDYAIQNNQLLNPINKKQ